MGDRLAPPGGLDEEGTRDDDKPFDPSALLDYASFVTVCLRRHAVAGAAVAALGVAFTFLAVSALPRTYRVETSILVQGDFLFAPLATGSADRTTTTKGVVEVILRRANLLSLSVINIGVEEQIILGALAATWFSLQFRTSSP